MTEKLALTPEEAAEAIGVSRRRIYELLRTGDLPSVKLGRVRRIRTEKLREYLDRLEAEQTPLVSDSVYSRGKGGASESGRSNGGARAHAVGAQATSRPAGGSGRAEPERRDRRAPRGIGEGEA